MLSMARCGFRKHGKMIVTSVNVKTLKKTLGKLVHDEIQGWQRSLTIMQKLKQNKNVSETSGESKNFEGHIAAKRGIVKIHWKFVSFLTPQNRHVRATTGIVERAERCKIEEVRIVNIRLKKYIYFWQNGSKTICFVSSGAQSAGGRILLL